MNKYLLVLHNTYKKVRLTVNRDCYLIYVNSIQDALYNPKDDFTLKEKLYILNSSLEVVWIPISDVHFGILKIFNNMATSRQIKINVVNGTVFPQILRRWEI